MTTPQTDALTIAYETEDAPVLRAADAWQVEGWGVWNAVQAAMVEETPSPLPVAANALLRSVYEQAVLDPNTMAEVRRATIEANSLPRIDLTQHTPERDAIALLPAEIARQYRVLPIRKQDKRLYIACAEPRNIQAIDAIRMATRCQVFPMQATPHDAFDAALDAAYPPERDLMRELQSQLAVLRGEIGELREQFALLQAAATHYKRPVPPRPSPPLFPHTPPADVFGER